MLIFSQVVLTKIIRPVLHSRVTAKLCCKKEIPRVAERTERTKFFKSTSTKDDSSCFFFSKPLANEIVVNHEQIMLILWLFRSSRPRFSGQGVGNTMIWGLDSRRVSESDLHYFVAVFSQLLFALFAKKRTFYGDFRWKRYDEWI